MIQNTTGANITGVHVVLVIGPAVYDLWGSNLTIPAGNSLILTQTNDTTANIDTSDYAPNPYSAFQASGVYPTSDCFPPSSSIPTVNLTIGSTTYTYYDNGQIINTRGSDWAHCVGGDESQTWTAIGMTANTPTPTPTATTPGGPTYTPTLTPDDYAHADRYANYC